MNFLWENAPTRKQSDADQLEELANWNRKSRISLKNPKIRKDLRSTINNGKYNVISDDTIQDKHEISTTDSDFIPNNRVAKAKTTKARKSLFQLQQFQQVLNENSKSKAETSDRLRLDESISNLKLADAKEILLGNRLSDLDSRLKSVLNPNGAITVEINFDWVNRILELVANCVRTMFYSGTYLPYLTITALSESHSLAMRTCMSLMPFFVYKPANKIKPIKFKPNRRARKLSVKPVDNLRKRDSNGRFKVKKKSTKKSIFKRGV